MLFRSAAPVLGGRERRVAAACAWLVQDVHWRRTDWSSALATVRVRQEQGQGGQGKGTRMEVLKQGGRSRGDVMPMVAGCWPQASGVGGVDKVR